MGATTLTKRLPLDPRSVRQRFPALARRHKDKEAVYFDGPAGSQIPTDVADAVAHYLLHQNANHGGVFATSRESDAMVDNVRRACSDFLNASDPDEIVFGPNMTSLTFAFSRALARTWVKGDEIVVTQLDHDANVTPWVLAARDAGVVAHHVRIHSEDATLDLEDLEKKLSPRTRLVAFAVASNAVGTVNPVRAIVDRAHSVGALTYVDAVHSAPHRLPDVKAWGTDVAVCSAYKFFGPHSGVLWSRRELLERWPADKVRPAPDSIPDRWMTGTPALELIAGVGAAVQYLADLGRSLSPDSKDRRAALIAAYDAIELHENALLAPLLDGLRAIPGVTIWGISDPNRFSERVPTVSFTHARLRADEIARRLAEQGIFSWSGNFYALPLTTALGLEPDGMLRIGLLHYNTREEVDRLIAALKDMS